MDYKQAYERFTAGAETKPLYFVNKLQWDNFAREMGLEWTQKNCRLTEPMKEAEMDINVGDKVRYNGPSEYDLTHGKVYEVFYVCDDWLEVVDDVGDYQAFYASDCEPVTDTSQAVPDYNNGEWHGWNGGECPVHSETRVDLVQWQFLSSQSGKAGGGRWDAEAGIVSFRVTNPYVEPKKPREWWINPIEGDVDVCEAPVRQYIHVREVLDD